MLGASILLLPSPEATAANCTGGALAAVLGVSPTVAHIGDTITITTLGVSLGSPVCNVTNGQSFVVYPSGAASRAMYQTNFILTSPQSENCIGLGAPAPDGSCRPVASTYVIQAADVGRDLSWSTPRGHGFSVPGQAGFIQFDAGSDAFTVPTGAGQTPQLEGGDAPQSVVIVTPRISVTKNCVNTCTPYGQPIQFAGTVCNTGDDTLAGVTASDNPAATITFSTTTSFGTNSFPAGGGGLLRPGECVNYTGIYMPSGNLCGPFTDTIVASGTDFSDDPAFTPKTVFATNSATCHVSKNPGLLLSKNCFNSTNAASHSLDIGSSWVDVFTVTNTGNVPLTNVVITDVDSKLGTITIIIGSLPIGGSATRAFTNGPTTAADCGITISDSATVRGDSVCPLDATCPGPTSVTNGPATCSLTVAPCVPHVSILKGVTCAPAAGIAGCDGTLTYRKTAEGVAGTNNPAFCYQIIVVNDGQTVLTNVNVMDAPLGPLAGFPTTLAIGERRTNYTSASWGVGGHTNTAIVTGFNAQSGAQVSATNSAVAVVVPASVSCNLILSSSLNENTNNVGPCQVTLPSPLPGGASNTPVTVTITINNTGQADLDVRVIDGTVLSLVNCSNNTPLNLGNVVVRIPAGGSFTTNGCVLVSCPGTTVTATVQGTAVATATIPCIYDSFGNVIKTAPSSCQQCVNCKAGPPHVSILKGVACAPAAGIAGCDGTLAYHKTAQGVAGTNNPAFCYQIIVVNDGDQALTNVNVIDTLLGALSGYPTSLAIGQRKTNYTSMSWGVGTHVNTAVVSGFGDQSGTQVSATNGATAVVVPASVSCSLTLSSSLNLNTNGSGPCQVTLPSPLPNGASNTPVTVSITVNNTGQADLNVRIIDGTVLSLVSCADDVTPLNLGNLVVRVPAGGSFTTNGCVLVACPGTTVTATVQGTAVASTNIPCIYDSLGNAIKTAPSSCQQCVNCTEAVVCRVTGGGVLDPTNVDQSCILMVTTLSPAFSQVDGGPQLALTKITHGGQLGAPFSQRDCGEVLGNPCIRGQWEHVRHYQGKGNPRDVVTAFHSVTPKGQFDTLNCACLGCCDPASGAFIPPVTGPLIKKFALCNPDDHRICGPEPRPAPANAIIFTGVGQLTPTTDNGTDNKNSQWVIFRVYIEDRSEPGGNHPKGAIDPADVYCFQAWYTGIPVSKKPDFSTIAAAFRRALGGDSCAFLEALNSGALPIGSLPNTTVGGMPADIVDQGPLYDGNHQIHPATGATCP